jgi:predicted nuclease of predicted toxin-antitoxin system
MPRTIRFHLDEHCPTALAEGLRRRGIDVTTTPEVVLPGAEDPEHVRFALAEGRVIFTQDEDFLAIHAAGISHHQVRGEEAPGFSRGEESPPSACM